MDLLLLAFGIIAAAVAAVLVGAPSADLIDRPFDQLGLWTTVLALVVIALGNHLRLCAPRRSVTWILLVLVTAIVGTNSRLAPADFTATMVTVLANALGCCSAPQRCVPASRCAAGRSRWRPPPG